jgi:hypothetical protein
LQSARWRRRQESNLPRTGCSRLPRPLGHVVSNMMEHDLFRKPVSTPGSSPGAGSFGIMLRLVHLRGAAPRTSRLSGERSAAELEVVLRSSLGRLLLTGASLAFALRATAGSLRGRGGPASRSALARRLVRPAGNDPATSAMSGPRSATELRTPYWDALRISKSRPSVRGTDALPLS